MVRHQERRTHDGDELVAARALRIHLAAGDALEVRERGVAVRARAERSVHHEPPATRQRCLGEPDVEGHFARENTPPAAYLTSRSSNSSRCEPPTMTLLSVWLGGTGGRYVRRSVVRAWEPCASVAGSVRILLPFRRAVQARRGQVHVADAGFVVPSAAQDRAKRRTSRQAGCSPAASMTAATSPARSRRSAVSPAACGAGRRARGACWPRRRRSSASGEGVG